MPNMLDDPDRPMIHLPPRQDHPQRITRLIGDWTLAVVACLAWAALLVVAGTAVFIVARICWWAAQSVLTALGCAHG